MSGRPRAGGKGAAIGQPSAQAQGSCHLRPCTCPLAAAPAPLARAASRPLPLPLACVLRCPPRSIKKFGLDSSADLTGGLVAVMLLDFLYLAALSTLLGMAFGLVTAYCLRAFSFHHVSQARTGRWGCTWIGLAEGAGSQLSRGQCLRPAASRAACCPCPCPSPWPRQAGRVPSLTSVSHPAAPPLRRRWR